MTKKNSSIHFTLSPTYLIVIYDCIGDFYLKWFSLENSCGNLEQTEGRKGAAVLEHWPF